MIHDLILRLSKTKKLKVLFHRVAAIGVHMYPLLDPLTIQGPGSLKELPTVLRAKGINKPLIVTDNVLVSLGLVDGLTDAMKEISMPYAIYDGVEPDPSVENVEDAFVVYKRENCDCVIGFGGGSPMDAAKIVAARVARPNRHTRKMAGLFMVTLPFPKKLPRIVGVPTTAGTGAEATFAAVISDHKNNAKYTINDVVVRPHMVVLDPELTLGLPPQMTVYTAIDALSHATEAYVGHARCRRSDRCSRNAIKLIFENLDTVYEDGKNINARSKMLEAANDGGKCLIFGFTTYVHPFAHKIGALYGLVHGACIGAVMPHVLEFYRPEADERLAELAELIGVASPGMSTSDKASAYIQALRDLNEKYSVSATIPQIKDEDFREIADAIYFESLPYPVPKLIDDDTIFGILRKLQGK